LRILELVRKLFRAKIPKISREEIERKRKERTNEKENRR